MYWMNLSFLNSLDDVSPTTSPYSNAAFCSIWILWSYLLQWLRGPHLNTQQCCDSMQWWSTKLSWPTGSQHSPELCFWLDSGLQNIMNSYGFTLSVLALPRNGTTLLSLILSDLFGRGVGPIAARMTIARGQPKFAVQAFDIVWYASSQALVISYRWQQGCLNKEFSLSKIGTFLQMEWRHWQRGWEKASETPEEFSRP